MTYNISKREPEYYNRHGGKTQEEAKARGNSLDTRYSTNTVRAMQRTLGVLLNSKRLNRATIGTFVSRNTIQDLRMVFGVRSMFTQPSTSLQTMKEEVERKQKDLMVLARLKGTYDSTVLKRQLLLAKSKLFREYAVKLISVIPGSVRKGDYVRLAEYLREQVYHPNRYRATPVIRVLVEKPGKGKKRPLAIPLVKDRALQALVNLVLLPLVELNSDPNSYGFRPYRDCKMAIAQIRAQLRLTDAEKVGRAISKKTVNLLKQDKCILEGHIIFSKINHN